MADSIWRSWDTDPPPSGAKVVIVCNDGCSSALALIVDGDGEGAIAALDGEDGYDLTQYSFTKGALWVPLPDDYPLRFMEADDDDR